VRPTPIAIALILAAGLAAPAARADSDGPPPYMERSERTVEPAGIRTLEVDNPRGHVELTASADGRLHVVATKVCRMGNRDEARRFAAETTVETGIRDGRYSVRVHYPRRIESRVNFWDLFSERGRHTIHMPVLEVRVEIQAPPALPAVITTTSGDIAARGRSGALELRSSSGDLEVEDARGPLDAETTSGDLTLRGIASAHLRSTSGDVSVDGADALAATTTSGDLSVSGARGELALESASGDIVVVDAPAGVRAHTVSGELVLRGACGRVDGETQSGDIRARLRAPLQDAKLSSVSGEVAVDLVPGLAATIAARSVSGSIDCRVPVTVLGHDRNSLDARIGQGGAPVRLESTSGNVSIMSGGK
jgi:hypothetical protein